MLAFLTLGARAAEIGQLPLHQRQLDAMGVEFRPISSRGDASSLALPARVVIPPRQMRVLSAPAAGVIEELRVAPQQQLRSGEPLGRLMAPALLEAQRALIQAASQARLANENSQRDQGLLAEGIIGAARAHASQAQAIEAEAARREREQNLRLIGMPAAAVQGVLDGVPQPPLLELVSPGSGTVIEVMAASGQRVDLGAPLLKLARLDRLWLELQVPVASVAAYRVGDRLEVQGRGAHARIVNVGRTAQAESQVVEVRAELAGAAGLRPGESVAVLVRASGDGGSNWLLPQEALVTGAQGPQVYVRTANGIRVVPVQKTGDSPEGPLVRGELKSGDRVATRGVAALRAAENASREPR